MNLINQMASGVGGFFTRLATEHRDAYLAYLKHLPDSTCKNAQRGRFFL